MNREVIFRAAIAGSFVGLMLLAIAGCGGEPTLYPIEGKVTLGGKAYNRLIVYFRPIDEKVNAYNLGVGETDVQGILGLRSTAGQGLAAGNYRVSFTCMEMKGGKGSAGLGEKMDDQPGMTAVERVPPEYCDAKNSPVEFVVTAGTDNYFEFDIPLK